MIAQALARLIELEVPLRLRRLRRVRNHPHECQSSVLDYLLRRAQHTSWGRRYCYAELRGPHAAAEFSRRVPVRTYEQLYPELEKALRGEPDVLWPGPAPRWLAKSSGTTNARSKYIPVTDEALWQNHYRGGRDTMALALSLYPRQRLLRGKSLSLGGTLGPGPFESGGRSGDVSALFIRGMPAWAQQLRTPPLEIALLSDWDEKLERIAHHVQHVDVRVLAGAPTWMLMLLRRVLELTGATDLTHVWPRLGLFMHGAVAFGPYREMFRQLIPSAHMRYLEIYNASEGHFALQDEPGSEDLLLLLDHGIYYEFLPAAQYDGPYRRPVPLEAVEVGRNYALVVSTNAGLWRYLVGDTVRFTSTRPYRLRITGRTKHFLNAFGEELVIETAEAAVTGAAQATGTLVRDFTAAPVYPASGVAAPHGGHEWAVEFSGRPPREPARFAEVLDHILRQLNSDYDTRRHNNLALAPPRLHVLPAGTFERWLRGQGKLGGQHKVPRLSNSRQVLEQVLSLD